MPIEIYIGGVDYANYVDLRSVKINSNIAVNSDTATFTVIISQRGVPRPKGGQEIVIGSQGVREFGGVIMNPKETAVATDVMAYDVQCRDYKYWLDRRVVTNTYNGYTAGNIVKDIVDHFTSGFTSTQVQGTDSSFWISQIKVDHEPPSKMIKKLADDIGFQWWVDYYKNVVFAPTSYLKSPLPGNVLYSDSDSSNLHYGDLILEEDVTQIRNQIYYLGYKTPADYNITEKVKADGQISTFYTTYEPKHAQATITFKVGNTIYDKANDIAGGLPDNQLEDGKVYIYYKNKSFRLNVAPITGTTISIKYIPMFERISMHNDPGAMDVMKARDRQDGVYEHRVRDQQLSSIDEGLVNTRALFDLVKYAYPHFTGQFHSFLQGWQPAQYFTFYGTNRMDGELNGHDFYVTKVTKDIVNHPLNGEATFRYNISISDTIYVY